jgi:nitric oxide reductase subunit B
MGDSMSSVKMVISKAWAQAALLTFLLGFTGLGILAALIYSQQAPLPERVTAPSGEVLFTRDDVLTGQHVFQKHELMQFGTIYGHGAYLGPDFTAQYLHAAARDMLRFYGEKGSALPVVRERVIRESKTNAYDATAKTLVFSSGQAHAFGSMERFYRGFFGPAAAQRGLKRPVITDAAELHGLTAFFAWAAWTASTSRPGEAYSYTNNWPDEPLVGNAPTAQNFFWSVVSLISLLCGVGLVLFFFGRFPVLGWHRADEEETVSVRFRPPEQVGLTPSQRATAWYFLVVAGLFLAQGLLGGVNAHYHAEPNGFYGLNLAEWLPYNLSRTWHLQLALFFVSASFLAMGIFITPMIAGREPKHQDKLAIALFGALVVIVVGSLAGEALSVKDVVTRAGPWFWVGAQGWEYLDLGRLWQLLLTAGMFIWVVIVFRGLRSHLREEHPGNLPFLFLYSALSIPVFYAVGMLFGRDSHFVITDFWRFWVVHLWVEDFLELFTTIMVAYIFVLLGVVSRSTATRVIYLDVILYSVGGVIGTMHHLYFSGSPAAHMAAGAFFSAMEVIPLVLLTVEAYRFMRLGANGAAAPITPFPHKWAVMFLIAVGFWNFLGAGVFGFLINLPFVSYYEIGTQFTANHGHGAMMGVYGMLAMGFFVFVARYFIPPDRRSERAMKISFWSLNIGLGYMMFANLVPIGMFQLFDSFQNGYWHARAPEFAQQPAIRILEWLRLPGDALFIVGGILPIVYLAARMFRERTRYRKLAGGEQAEEFTQAAPGPERVLDLRV